MQTWSVLRCQAISFRNRKHYLRIIYFLSFYEQQWRRSIAADTSSRREKKVLQGMNKRGVERGTVGDCRYPGATTHHTHLGGVLMGIHCGFESISWIVQLSMGMMKLFQFLMCLKAVSNAGAAVLLLTDRPAAFRGSAWQALTWCCYQSACFFILECVS